jgi:hypothetical protein
MRGRQLDFLVVTVTAIIVIICQLFTAYNQFYYHHDMWYVSQHISNAPPNTAFATRTYNDGTADENYPYGLTIPKTPAVALPSIRLTDEEDKKVKRKFYGGAGDKAHLGGFTTFDPMGVSPTLW